MPAQPIQLNWQSPRRVPAKPIGISCYEKRDSLHGAGSAFYGSQLPNPVTL